MNVSKNSFDNETLEWQPIQDDNDNVACPICGYAANKLKIFIMCWHGCPVCLTKLKLKGNPYEETRED